MFLDAKKSCLHCWAPYLQTWPPRPLPSQLCRRLWWPMLPRRLRCKLCSSQLPCSSPQLCLLCGCCKPSLKMHACQAYWSACLWKQQQQPRCPQPSCEPSTSAAPHLPPPSQPSPLCPWLSVPQLAVACLVPPLPPPTLPQPCVLLLLLPTLRPRLPSPPSPPPPPGQHLGRRQHDGAARDWQSPTRSSRRGLQLLTSSLLQSPVEKAVLQAGRLGSAQQPRLQPQLGQRKLQGHMLAARWGGRGLAGFAFMPSQPLSSRA